jgi:hypothetical protein
MSIETAKNWLKLLKTSMQLHLDTSIISLWMLALLQGCKYDIFTNQHLQTFGSA